MSTENRIEKIRDFLEKELSGTNPDELVMKFIHVEEIEKTLGLAGVILEEMRQAATLLNSELFGLKIRSNDEYSETPYFWVTPKIKSFEKKGVLPDPCFVIRSPDGTQSLRIKEGLLVFSTEGYAIHHAVTCGLGDFNVQSFSSEELRKGGAKHSTAVVNFSENTENNLVSLI